MEPKGDSLIGLLNQLHDVAEPPPVPMWPATWAWAILAALLLALLVAGTIAFLRHRRATAWRRAALSELDALAPALEAGEPGALAALQTLLRRVALVTAPRPEVASLTGAGWSDWLEETGGDFGALGPALGLAPYRPAGPYDGAAALAAARAWIRRQRLPGGPRHA
ncbi:DUF4381 domain-containing protein [Amaricoccus solimangrovi]|uniref:DUF4381 domain-containing protein n=1 Tax=Amaricoccus solimangrovi TaxID=2589815 RepID=A0A501WF23_9RHOB|nr:DUF4381 domain-containing protein [Amaricoccus solimangrovi]TPE46950.1 DUF4381 domain-containing protein [Amaricoccus solimangrovi]